MTLVAHRRSLSSGLQSERVPAFFFASVGPQPLVEAKLPVRTCPGVAEITSRRGISYSLAPIAGTGKRHGTADLDPTAPWQNVSYFSCGFSPCFSSLDVGDCRITAAAGICRMSRGQPPNCSTKRVRYGPLNGKGTRPPSCRTPSSRGLSDFNLFNSPRGLDISMPITAENRNLILPQRWHGCFWQTRLSFC